MRSIGEFLHLLWLKPLVSLKKALHELFIISRYPSSFVQADRALKRLYKNESPFSVHRRFLKQQNASDLYTYGETYLHVLERIGKLIELSTRDLVLELGCGTGRGLQFLAHQFGCQCVGIELCPEFAQRAKQAKITVVEGDFHQLCWPKATFVYFYELTMSDEEIISLKEKFASLPQHAMIVTVSFPLTDFPTYRECLSLEGSFSAPFLWGRTDVYIHRRR